MPLRLGVSYSTSSTTNIPVCASEIAQFYESGTGMLPGASTGSPSVTSVTVGRLGAC